MPRPKSAITGQRGFVGIRLTEAQREAYKKLGGPAWLRGYLDDMIAGRKKAPASDTRGTAKVVAVRPARPKQVPYIPKTTWHP